MTTERSDNTSNQIQKIATWVLVLSPILQTYGWGKYDFAFFATSFVAVLALIRSKIRIKDLPKFLIPYLVYWLVIHIISATSVSEAIPLGVIKTILVYGTFFSLIKLPQLIKSYRIVVRACVVFFFLQFFVRSVIGISIPGVFSFLPLALDTDAATYFQFIAETQRPCSFFSEPAAFAQYLAPYFIFTLFDGGFFNKKGKFEALAIAFSLLLMQSGNALLGLLVGLFFYVIYKMRGGAVNKLRSAILIVVITGGAAAFLGTSIGQNVLSRQAQLSANSVDELGYSTSGFERIYRGYFVYDEYSALYRIIGNDNANYKIDAAKRSKVSSWFNNDYMYYNTVQGYLLNTGLIGLLLMFLVYYNIWKRTDFCGKSILATFIAYNFISSAYFTETMCIYLLIPTLLGRYRLLLQSNALKINGK